MTKIKIYLIFLIPLAWGCANIQAPSGGPEDKTPPEIAMQYPQQNTLNFSGNEITVEFSKWMNRGKVQENIFLLPTADVEYDWDGKTLKIIITGEMRENTTYSLNLGTDYTDYWGNPPAESYTMIFSTGAVIDSGIISGILYDKEPLGAYVFAYKIDGINPDTLNPEFTKPDYKIQTGTNGKFEFKALKDGTYRVFAIRDELKDGLYGRMDAFGAARNDVIVSKGKSEPIALKLGPPIDNTGPALFGAQSLYNNLLSLRFSEVILDTSVSPDAFLLQDSAGIMEIGIKAAYFDSTGNENILLVPESPLDTALIWKITALPQIADTVGNPVRDTTATAFFKPDARNYESPIFIRKSSIQDSAKAIEMQPKITYEFNTAIVLPESGFIELTGAESNEKHGFTIGKSQPNKLVVIPDTLTAKASYNLKIDFTKIRALHGSTLDTAVNIHFTAADYRDLADASGIIKKAGFCESDLYILLTADKIDKPIKIKSRENGFWNMRFLQAGDYGIEVFCDENGNGVHDTGQPFPFRFAEKFRRLDKTLKIKARWNVEDFIIEPLID